MKLKLVLCVAPALSAFAGNVVAQPAPESERVSPQTVSSPLPAAAAKAVPVPVPDEGSLLDFKKPSLAFQLGLIQPLLLGGANVEADFRVGHLVIDYSHGWNLNLEDSAIVGEMKRQNITMRVNYTTGLGVGYSQHVDSLRSFFELRFEPKLHRFEVSYGSSDGGIKTAIAQYNTVTLGGGFYWTVVPFSHRKDLLRGLNLSTSFRAWPKVATTLSGNEVAYENKTTGRRETHSAANIGVADTPFFANISVGYLFQ
jgi:hypothetical protein